MVDPPEGWKYGFPKVLEPSQNYKLLLRESGYPEELMELALTNSRFWKEEYEDTEE
jgi:hypothetical protein